MSIIGTPPTLAPTQLSGLIYGKHTNIKALLLAGKVLGNGDTIRRSGIQLGSIDRSMGLQQIAILPPEGILVIGKSRIEERDLLEAIGEFFLMAPGFGLTFEMRYRSPFDTSRFELFCSSDSREYLKITYDLKNTMPEAGLQPAHLV